MGGPHGSGGGGAMVADEARIRRSLQILESTGQYVDPEMLPMPEPVGVTVTPSCYSVFTALFGRTLNSGQGAAQPVPTKEVVPKKKPASKLEQASEALQARVDTLNERATSLRASASSQFKAGDKRSALLSMKRAKATEAAAESACKAQLAVENQLDALEQANVQAAISTALAASVKRTQKSSRGLLQKTESAADGAMDVMETSQDVASALAEMAPGAGEDEDELMAELEAMMDNEPPPAPTPAIAPIPSVSAAVLGQLPKAPVTHYPGVPVPNGSVLLGA